MRTDHSAAPMYVDPNLGTDGNFTPPEADSGRVQQLRQKLGRFLARKSWGMSVGKAPTSSNDLRPGLKQNLTPIAAVGAAIGIGMIVSANYAPMPSDGKAEIQVQDTTPAVAAQGPDHRREMARLVNSDASNAEWFSQLPHHPAIQEVMENSNHVWDSERDAYTKLPGEDVFGHGPTADSVRELLTALMTNNTELESLTHVVALAGAALDSRTAIYETCASDPESEVCDVIESGHDLITIYAGTTDGQQVAVSLANDTGKARTEILDQPSEHSAFEGP